MSYEERTASPDPTDVANAHLDRWWRTHDRRDLDRAVEWYRAALREAPDERGRRSRSANLRVGLWLRWSAFHDDRDRDELIALCGEAAAEDDAAEQDLLFLGVALGRRFDDERRREDLDRAIGALRRTVAVPLDRSRNRATALASLGQSLVVRFEHAGDPRDLAEAERAFHGSLSHLPPGDPERPSVMGGLALAREHAFDRTGDPETLSEGLALRRAALAESPPGARYRASALDGLGAALRKWVEVLPDESAVDELLRVTRTALAEAPQRTDAPARLTAQTRLGVALRLAAENGGGTALLHEAVDLLRAAVRHTPPGGRDRGLRLNSLGNALHRLGERTGDAALLDEAIDALREAVADGRPGRPFLLANALSAQVANLAIALRERYHQTGDLAALREAAELARQAVQSCDLPLESTSHLANLGVVLQTWYNRTGDTSAADEAVTVAREVLARTPEDSPHWTGRANHLANALYERYRAAGDPAGLEEGIALQTRAVDATAYGDPRLPVLLHNLGKALLTKAEAREDPAVLDQAVTTLGRAVWAPDENEAEHANHLQTYASALRTLHDVAGDPGVLLAAEDAYRQVARIAALPAGRRIGAARDWGAAAADAGRWEEALRGYRLAVELLPFGVTRRLARSDQEHRLTGVHGLAADAAACAVHAGEPERAVLLLEQGRGVLLGQAIAARGDWERLRGAHPEAAGLFLRLRDRIDELGAVEEQQDGEQQDDERHRLAAQWEGLVTHIRTLPGFAGFLAAPALGSLLACADRGPVVLAYCSRYRSDALVLRPDGVQVVSLPQVTPASVAHQVARLDDALAAATDPAGEQRAQRTLGEVLGWAWDHVAEPVLARLGLLGPPSGDDWPRLWWSPGGALSALPLHAAGHHDGHRAVLDRVISSYTPTVRALAYARARAAGPVPPGRLLAVAQPETPGARPLHGARREVAELAKLLPCDLVTGPDATLARVVRALPEHPYAHFACHGVSDPDDPSNARLLVHDHQRAPLTARQISRLDLPGARLAVLSACETARGAKRLADESIHITSAFQIAGYPHAIGTLWPVHDAVAVRVARSLYRRLREGRSADSPVLDTGRSAVALHHAVRECRAAFPRTPSLWAAHVHSGP
ncbi:CHAT domain-containing protein [Streptomyces sp. CoH27]|uniref:CHAT domain-containing protein n=1 Tax=Streptomyces sp. CoH27 TaxID=2875763 RepID=UPI001CD2ADFD|nr:CHAT domain-containing protein [Streptomyces sp. CoH27]